MADSGHFVTKLRIYLKLQEMQFYDTKLKVENRSFLKKQFDTKLKLHMILYAIYVITSDFQAS